MSSCDYTDQRIIYFSTDIHAEVKQFVIFEENVPRTKQINLACDKAFQTQSSAKTIKLLKFLVHVRVFEKFPETLQDARLN